MVKLTFILIGVFIVIHFTLYYWNVDPFNVFTGKKELIEELKKTEDPVIDTYDFGNIKNNLEDCLNELKQYNSININNESLESLD
jgi:hypothetical protein